MTIMTSAGSTLGTSATVPGTINAANLDALTFTAVGEITDLGEFGKEYNMVSHTALGNRQVRKFKGSFNNGALQLQMGRDTTDAGQTALRTALATDNPYSFKVTLQNGIKLLFTGMVMSYKTSVGSVDQITGATTTIEINSEIFEI